MPTQPNLGYGQPSEATIDQVNIWMRGQPWYQQQMQAWGQDPGHPTLTKSQSDQILRMAQQQGVIVDQGNMEVDDHGNFNPKGHKLRNTLLVAGIAAATIATMGAAGVFSGVAGAGAGAGAASGAGLAGIEGGAYGLGDAALAGLGTGAMGATGVGAAGLASIEGGAYGLGSDAVANLGTGAMGANAGDLSTIAGSGLPSAAGGTLSTIGNMLKKGAPIVGALGSAVGDATSAAGNNRLEQERMGLTANGQNITGQSAFEQELMKRASLEQDQRKDALKNIYRSSYAQNAIPGPYNAKGLTPYSPEYLAALKSLSAQGSGQLASGLTYDTSKLPALAPYTPLNVADVQGSTGTKKGTLEQIGDWLSPALSTYGAIGRLGSR